MVAPKRNNYKYISLVSLFINLLLLIFIFIKFDVIAKLSYKFGNSIYIPERCDYNCILGWTNTVKQLDVQRNVVFFGNSLTCDGHFQEYFPTESVANLGYPGDDTKGMLRRVEQIFAFSPKKIFVMAGINGIDKQSFSQFEKQYDDLISAIVHSNKDSAEIYLQSILPVGKKFGKELNLKIGEANKIVLSIAQKYNLTYIDLHTLYVNDYYLPDIYTYDGLHLTPEAYVFWKKAVDQYVHTKQ